jgi:hypothetical protein
MLSLTKRDSSSKPSEWTTAQDKEYKTKSTRDRVNYLQKRRTHKQKPHNKMSKGDRILKESKKKMLVYRDRGRRRRSSSMHPIGDTKSEGNN